MSSSFRVGHGFDVHRLVAGRPLIIDRELQAADAFVVAWLPGTQGGGVADVLIGAADGRARYDFSGTLSFTWPRAHGAVSFAQGFGLKYAGGPGTPPHQVRRLRLTDAAPH